MKILSTILLLAFLITIGCKKEQVDTPSVAPTSHQVLYQFTNLNHKPLVILSMEYNNTDSTLAQEDDIHNKSYFFTHTFSAKKGTKLWIAINCDKADSMNMITYVYVDNILYKTSVDTVWHGSIKTVIQQAILN